jgi:lipopolysaccharide transport system ATP-binding protein
MPNKKTQEEIAIEVKNVSKSFTVYYDRANSFKERILFLGRNKKKEKREILKDINLTIKKGEVVGLIGINGSRKINIIKTYDKNNISR